MKEILACPLCKSKEISVDLQGALNQGAFIRCDRCAEYLITSICVEDHSKVLAKIGYILSGLSRELFETEQDCPSFKSDNLEEYLKNYIIPNVKSVEEKANKLLSAFRKKTNYFGEKIETDYDTDTPLGYAQNNDEYNALVNLLEEKNLIRITGMKSLHGKILKKFVITADGWALGNKFKEVNGSLENGFIASWFHPDTNENIKAIEEAVNEAGYKAVCIKDDHFSEKIMDKALGEIRKSRFAIIDLTGNRNSVFFEAGFAFGLGVEIIYVYKKNAEENTDLEFYVKHYKCYPYENPAELKEILLDAIKARIVKK